MAISRRALYSAVAALLFAGAAHAQNPNVKFDKSEMTIESGGKSLRFTVEIADNDDRRMLGLMHRRQMAADAGMLFDFKRDAPVAMWMRNTLIPLDMLFADKDGVIRHIHERAVPLSEAIISSDGAVRGVLELNGGTVSRLGIKVGDRMVHPMFR
jgi:uncharacterized membrane protein (UPF0127 family)